ncbi:hypothetical protein [Brevundimonas poindexterae]|uniref:hypothetical protein n=1 Tax=Brevundimonas poindexterae TaxID=74325 RepID=UPI001CFDE2F3|nr:hypothetical protein [Brevundimonas poindexterae]
MTKPNENGPPQAAFDFDARFMRKGKRSAIVLLPPDYLAPIGLIIAHWGQFERLFAVAIDAMLRAEAADGIARDWVRDSKRTSFKTRCRLLKDLCREWLAIKRPEQAKALMGIIDRASSLASKRNLIAHGSYAYAIEPHSSTVTNCRAVDHDTGKEMAFDETVLKKLYHDIAHETAELWFTLRSFCTIDGQLWTFEDAEILRIYRETDHPWNPNPNRQKLTPQS